MTRYGVQRMAYYQPAATGVEMRPVQDEPTVAAEWAGPICFHGVFANSVECKKEGLFQGKTLFLCGVEGDQCKLFLESSDLANPKCRCGVHTRENTVKKESQNQGRKFLACGARKCKFFKWL